MVTKKQPASGRSRRSFLKYAGIGATTVTLAGCQRAQDAPNTQNNNQGTVKGSPGQFSKPFKIGVISRKSGLGETHTQAAKLGVETVNQNGGIGGQDVEFVLGATNGTAIKSKEAHRKLTRKENVDVTMGALSIRALMPLIAQSKTIHLSTAAPGTFPAELVSRSVSPIGGNPQEEYQKYKYFFRVGPINMHDLRVAAGQLLKNQAKQRGWNRISILVEQGNQSEGVVQSTKQRFEEEVGVTVPIAKTVSGSLSDWSPVFDEVERANTDLVFIVLVLGGTSFINQWADQQRNFEVGGIHILSMLPDYWTKTNGAVESVWTMNAMTPQTTNNPPHTKQFLTAFNQQFNGYPLYAGPLVYDAIRGYKHIVEAVGSRSPEKLIPYMENDLTYTKAATIPKFEFRGPDARFAHDPVWNSIHESGVPVFQQWQSDQGVSRSNVQGGGIMEAFAPEQNKSADYVKPPWMR